MTVRRFTSHKSRILLTLLIGVTLTQAISYLVWRDQENQKHYQVVDQVSENLAYRILSTMEFFEELPTSYRHIVLNQLRQMGGARFYVSINNQYLQQKEKPSQKDMLIARSNFMRILGQSFKQENIHISFTTAKTLTVHKDMTKLSDLPTRWSGRLMLAPIDSPISVIQIQLEDGQWLYVATMLPISDFMSEGWIDPHDLVYLLFMLIGASVIGAIIVHYQTKPLVAIQDAATTLSKDIYHPPIPIKGSAELRDVASIFNQLQSKIQGYIQERETIFSAMSHDLKTPITRLKLQAEMIPMPKAQERLTRDLNMVDTIIEDALTALKSQHMATSLSEFDCYDLLQEIKDELPDTPWAVNIHKHHITLYTQLLPLRRALSNFIENALHYGQGCEITVKEQQESIQISVRDYGPGIPASQHEIVFSPFVRLEHSRNRNSGGTGLGMGIARTMIRKLGGDIVLQNHAQKGLIVNIFLPKENTM
jgi:signal transduction histidine kinase